MLGLLFNLGKIASYKNFKPSVPKPFCEIAGNYLFLCEFSSGTARWTCKGKKSREMLQNDSLSEQRQKSDAMQICQRWWF